MTVYHMIIKESICFIHKIIYNNSPSSIFNLLTYGNDEKSNVRKVRRIRVKSNPICQKVKNSVIHRSVFLYNMLEYEVRHYNPKKT